MPEDAFLDEAERTRIAARLDDMRQTVGDEDFAGFIDKARTEFQDLAQHPEPWSTTQVERGLNLAMLLGVDSLEAVCREIAEDRSAPDLTPARQIARAAAAVLSAWARP